MQSCNPCREKFLSVPNSLLCAQGYRGIHGTCTACGEKARTQRDRKDKQGDQSVRGGIARSYLIQGRKKSCEKSRGREGTRQAGDGAGKREGCGAQQNLPDDIADRCREIFRQTRRIVGDCERLLARNRIFVDRMVGVGVLDRAAAVDWGLTGPLLRATGEAYDVRKAHPYLVYDRFDFEVPTGTRGDNYDRFLVRFYEIEQSMRIAEQCLKRLEALPGPVMIRDSRFALPPKKDVYNSIEGLMNHFKIVMEGIKIPAGEVYQAVEGANGELGFYLVSDGTQRPYRWRVRPPSLYNYQALPTMVTGKMLSDVVACLSSLNIIAKAPTSVKARGNKGSRV